MKKLMAALLLGTAALMAHGIHWEKDYAAAVKRAEAAKKPIFFVFSRHSCKWCRHLEQTTFKNAKVIETMNRDFINVIAYTDERDYVPRELWAPGTPALWFLDEHGKAMFQPIQGAVGAADFLRATEIVKKEYRKQAMKQR